MLFSRDRGRANNDQGGVRRGEGAAGVGRAQFSGIGFPGGVPTWETRCEVALKLDFEKSLRKGWKKNGGPGKLHFF